MITRSISTRRPAGYGVLIALLIASVPAWSQNSPANSSGNSSTAQAQGQNSQDGWKHFNGGWSGQSQTAQQATVAPAPTPTTAKLVPQTAEPASSSDADANSQNSAQNPPSNVPAIIPTNPPNSAPENEPSSDTSAPTSASAWKLTIPQGTYVTVRLNEPLSSDRNQNGDAFSATLEKPLIVNGLVIAQRGQTVGGRVAEAKKAGRVSGVSQLKLELTGLTLVDGQTVPIDSQLVSLNGGTTHGRDAAAIAGTTGFGAAVGAAAGWGTGAAIGAGAGLVASTIGVLVTRGRPTVLYPETQLTFQVSAPVTVDTERDPQAFRPATSADYGPSQQATSNYQAPAQGCGPYGCPPQYPYAASYPYPYYAYGPYYPYPYYWAPGFAFYYGPGYYGRYYGYRGGYWYHGGYRGGYHH